MKTISRLIAPTPIILIGFILLLAACYGGSERPVDNRQPVLSNENDYDQYKIVTLLPRDAIQAIDDPKFVSAGEADESYDSQEMILGVELNGEARAYSVPFLSSHEIVNDFVGGIPIAVTW